MPVGPIENEGGKLKSIENGWSVNVPFFGKGGGRWEVRRAKRKREPRARGSQKESAARSEIDGMWGCGVVRSALTMSSSDSSSGSAAAAAGAAPPPPPESAAAAGVTAAAANASGFARYSLICCSGFFLVSS